ncbi:MAG: AbgT family transporter, partial [Anaerolineales bacterium]|nr:AbgT family transporter [Anaerolineales bacterium]
ISFLSDYALPLVGLFFLVGGVGAGLISSENKKDVWKALVEGMGGIAPGILLILMAVSIKHIVVSGGIMDTILFQASQLFQGANPFVSSVLIYLLALLIEFFVASGSAKAFLMMPILLPLADLVGVTRQITVTAYCFGDGFRI